MALSIEQAQAQIVARRQEISAAQRGIQARQAALPETTTQRALRAIKGIAGVPAKQRIKSEAQRLVEQKEAVGQYAEQVGVYEKQVGEAVAQRKVAQAEYAQAKKYFAEGIKPYQFSGNIRKYMEQLEKIQEQDYIRGTQRSEYQKAVEKYQGQIEELKGAGFKPVYDAGRLTGFEDLKAQMSIPLPKFSEYLGESTTLQAPTFAYGNQFTGDLQSMAPEFASPTQIPVAISSTGEALGGMEQLRLQLARPELFKTGAPVMAAPEWSVTRAPHKTVMEKIREFPAKQWEAMTGRTPRETYGQVFEPRGRPAVSTRAGEVYVPVISGERGVLAPGSLRKVSRDVGRTAVGIVAATAVVAQAIPDYGQGIRDPFAKEARVVPERWEERPSWAPRLGTQLPPEYQLKEFRRDRKSVV